jgi:hypothetical protein
LNAFDDLDQYLLDDKNDEVKDEVLAQIDMPEPALSADNVVSSLHNPSFNNCSVTFNINISKV